MRQVEELNADNDRQGTNGQVDEESPAPGSLVDKDTTEQGSNDGRDTKDGTNDTLVFATIAERDQVCNDDHDHGHDTTSTNTGNTTSDDHHGHALGSTAQSGSNQEDSGSKQEGGLSTKDVTEATIQWLEGCRCQEVRDTDPGDVAQGVELVCDLVGADGDDGLIQGRQEDSEHQADEDNDKLSEGQSDDASIMRLRWAGVEVTVSLAEVLLLWSFNLSCVHDDGHGFRVDRGRVFLCAHGVVVAVWVQVLGYGEGERGCGLEEKGMVELEDGEKRRCEGI